MPWQYLQITNGGIYFKGYGEKKGMEDSFLIASCATSREEIGNSLHPGARAKLDEMGIPHKKRAAVQLTKKIILPMIICCVWISGISIM